MEKIKVLIVEDSAFMRKSLKRILESDREITVIGVARDGEESLVKAAELKPDVITMDINLPGIDGVTALQHIVADEICPVVMVSSLTQENAFITLEALELGAFDYVPKPGGSVSLNIDEVSDQIIAKVKAAGKYHRKPHFSRRKAKDFQSHSTSRRSTSKSAIQLKEKKPSPKPNLIQNAVAIGISTGGPTTLMEVITRLPKDLNAAIFVVQHMPESFTRTFAERLNHNSELRVKECESGEMVENRVVYLAKGGKHLLLRKKISGEIQIRHSSHPQMLFVPSVDVMMESVFEVFAERTVGVIMTGMGNDGANAMVKIHQGGGKTIAESEETAIVYGMPKEVIELGAADVIAPAHKVAGEIIKAISQL